MVLIALSTSFFASVILVSLSRPQSNARNDLGAVQASHTKPTSYRDCPNTIGFLFLARDMNTAVEETVLLTERKPSWSHTDVTV